MKLIFTLFFIVIPSLASASDDGWFEWKTTNGLTERQATEYVNSMTTISGPRGLTGNLRLRCRYGEVEGLIVFSSFFSSRNSFWSWSQNGNVIGTLFYAKPAANGQASFLDDNENAKRLASYIEQGGDFRIGVRVPDGPEIIFKLSMEGAKEFMTKLWSECGSRRAMETMAAPQTPAKPIELPRNSPTAIAIPPALLD